MTKDCPVEILQYDWEFDQVIDLYKRVKPKTVLEIGSLYGGTIYHWLNKGTEDVAVMSMDLFNNYSYAEARTTWHKWKRWNQKLEIVVCDSSSQGAVEIAKNIEGGIDWLFIDGDHDYEGAKKDYCNYFPLVNKGGYCMFHDIVGEPGVRTLWKEIRENNDAPYIEICHSKYHLGIGIIQKL